MQTAADVTLAVGLAGLSAYSTLTATTPIVVAGGPTSIAGPRWIVAAAQVVAALALVRRRRAPFATLVTVVVVLAVPRWPSVDPKGWARSRRSPSRCTAPARTASDGRRSLGS